MPEVEKEYKTDPFSFVFREIDIVHREITELRTDIREINRRLESWFIEVNKRFDRLYLLIIGILIGLLGGLIKLLFFS